MVQYVDDTIKYDQVVKLTSDINAICESSTVTEYTLIIVSAKLHTQCDQLKS